MSALEELAQAVLDGRVRVYASGHTFDGRLEVTYDIGIDPPAPVADSAEVEA